MKRPLLPAVLLALAGCDRPPAADVPAIVSPSEALCRPTPNGRDMTGCYVTLTSSRDDRLLSVASPAAAEGQIHEMKVVNGVMSMAELKDGLVLPAGEAVALRPGGNHIMLLGVRRPLRTGEQVSLTLTFEHAQPLGIRAVVGQPQRPVR